MLDGLLFLGHSHYETPLVPAKRALRSFLLTQCASIISRDSAFAENKADGPSDRLRESVHSTHELFLERLK